MEKLPLDKCNDDNVDILSDDTASTQLLVSTEKSFADQGNSSNTEPNSKHIDLDDKKCSSEKEKLNTGNSDERNVDSINNTEDNYCLEIDPIQKNSEQCNSVAKSTPENTDNVCIKCKNVISTCVCSFNPVVREDDETKPRGPPASIMEAKQKNVDETCVEGSNIYCKTVNASCKKDHGNKDVSKVGDPKESLKEKKRISVSTTDGALKQPTTSWSSLGVKRCENCKLTTDDLALFDSHICSRKSDKLQVKLVFSSSKFQCLNCDFDTSVRKKFEEHVALHLMAEPYICMNCGITFESKKVIETHVKVKHSNESVKCGLKGSKRISQIIDALHSAGKHVFQGRPVDNRYSQTNSNTSATKLPADLGRIATTSSVDFIRTSKNDPSSGLQPKDSDVIFVSSSSQNITVSSSRHSVAVSLSQKIQLPTKLSEIKTTTTVGPPAVVAPHPLLLVPLSGNIFMPIPNVGPRPNAPNTVSTMQQRPTVPVTTMQSQFINIAPVPVAPGNLIIRGGGIQSNQIRPTVSVTQSNLTANVHEAQHVNPSNQTRYIIIPQTNPKALQVTNQQPSQIVGQVPNMMFSSVGHTSTDAFSNMKSVPIMSNKSSLTGASVQSHDRIQQIRITGSSFQVGSTLASPVSVSSTSNCITKTTSNPLTDSYDLTTDNPAKRSVVTEKSSLMTDINNGNKLFFRKYGELYICDFCKSETPLEDSFKEHIWKHFHQMQNICKDCPSSYNSISPCSIVSKVMFGLHNSSAESQSLSLKSKSENIGSLKAKNCLQDIVTISDDEDDNELFKSDKPAITDKLDKRSTDMELVKGDQDPEDKSNTEPIVISSGKNSPVEIENGLEIKITSTFSLSDANKCVELDQGNTESRSDTHKLNEKANTSLDDKSGDKVIDTQSTTNKEILNVDLTKSSSTAQTENDLVGVKQISDGKNESDQFDTFKDSKTSAKPDILDPGLTKMSDMNDYSVLSAILSGPTKVSVTEQSKDSCHQNSDPDKAEIAVEIDRKPIAFPLVAFYKCGFGGCTFDAGTSQDFRDHLNQMHKNATEYKCAHCGHKSFTEDSHVRHLLFHSKPLNTLLFHCAVIGCRFKANLLHVYKEHLEQAHQNVILHRCHSCKDGFNSVDGLVEHLQKNLLKFVQCPYCSMKDGVRRNVVNHIANYHIGKPRQINVTSQLVCQERESNEFEKSKQDTMSKHDSLDQTTATTDTEVKAESDIDDVENEDLDLIKRITSNSQVMGATYFKCNSCSYIGIGQSKLNKHKELHTSGLKQAQRVFVCPECPHSTNTLQQFISHLNLHIGDHVCNIYTCQHCGFGTNMSNKIHHHVSTSHEISKNQNKETKDYTQRVVKFSVEVNFCKECRAAFKTKQAHRDHVLKSHGITTNEISGRDDFEPQKVVPRESTENDEDNHPRRFTCNECGWGTKKLSYLKSHIKRHYPGQDRTQITLFKCNYCEFTSTSKLIISSHSQKRHAGKLLRVRRIVETVYITDTPEDDMSIDKFHCDLCSFSSDKISGLQSHLMSCHSESKVEDQEKTDTHSAPKQQFVIPHGTVFKDFVSCSLCQFKTKKRIDLLRHVKSHPSLEFITETTSEGQTSDKIQNPLFESYYKLGSKRKGSVDGNGYPKKSRPTSPTIDYDRILMDSAKRDTGLRKQVATKSTTNRAPTNVKTMLYYLGGDQLHKKLKPCYSEFRQSPNYTCLICSDMISEKYALHKHILQHMNVYFYKCSYCEHGTLDSTSIMVHIQRVHRRSIQYNKLDVEEIDSHINKAIHHMKSQVSDGKSDITFEEMRKKSPSKSQNERLLSDKASPEKLVVIKDSPSSKPITPTKQMADSNSNISVRPIDHSEKSSLKQTDEANKQPENNTESGDKVVKIEQVSPKKEQVSPKRTPIKLRKNDKGVSIKNVVKEEMLCSKKQNDHSGVISAAVVKRDELLHPRLERQNDMIICTICDFKDSSRAVATKHICKHSNVRRFMCSICLHGFVSRWRGDITKHIDLKHRSADAECLWDDITPDDITNDGQPFNAVANVRFLSDFKATVSDDKHKFEKESVTSNRNTDRQPLKMKLSISNIPGNKSDKGDENFRKIFKCLICKETFKSKYAVFKHLRLKCNQQLYGCSLCKFKHTNEKEIKTHIKAKHESPNGEVVVKTRQDKIRMYKIPLTNRDTCGLNEECSANKGVIGSVSFKCIACKRTFKTRNACLYHAISQICKKDLLKCSSCDFKSVSDEDMDNHIKGQHSGSQAEAIVLPKEAKVEIVTTQSTEKLRVDSTGNITFFTKGSGVYHCKLCDFKTKKTSYVVQHQNMHQASPCYGCPYCGMKSNWTKCVRSHIKLRHSKKKVRWIHLKENSGTEKSKQSDSKTKNRELKIKNEDRDGQCLMHKCLQCSYKCETYSGVYRHIKRTESCNLPRFKCTKCSKFSSLNEELVKDHMKRVHNTKEAPEICTIKEMTKLVIVKKKASMTDDNAEDEEKKGESRITDKFSGIKDVETKVITCPSFSCSYKDNVLKVIEHYRKMHPYKIARCKMCPLSSKSLGILFKHFQDFHKLEDYFSTNFIECSASREELKEKRRLKKEDSVEGKSNAQKFHQCNRCDYTTKVRFDMKRHIYKHLKYKRFLCRLCKNDFFDQKQCENHLSHVHNTNAGEFDEIRNERLEQEVEGILEKNVSYKVIAQGKSETIARDHQTASKTENSVKKKTRKRPTLSDTSHEKNDFVNFDPVVYCPSTYIQEIANSKTNDTEYLCTKCPYKSIARSSSSRHSYKHMPKCMKCPYCNFHDYPRADVRKHVKNKHPEKAVHVVDLRYQVSDSESRRSSKPPKKKRKLSLLDFDAEIFTSDGSSDEENLNELRLKKANIRSKRTEKSLTGDKVKKTTYTCHVCDFTSDVLYLYRQHLTLHPGFSHQIQGTSLESKNKCGYCGYIAKSSKEFDAHMERHLNSRPYNCPYCQFSQYTHSSVRIHVQKIHPTKKVEVLKDSSSSFLTGDGKVPKTMLVNIEPKVRLTDIFTMESELFENLLVGANVNVIDLHSIPDDQFGNVSKLLGVNGDDASEFASIAKPVIEESDDSANDVVDGACDTDVNNRKYCDDSDDETHIADDESPMDCDDLSDLEEDNDKSVNQKTKAETIDTSVDKSLNTSNQSVYEDISDTEMDDTQFVTNDGEKFIVKSELTYEDISDDENV